MSNWVHLTIAIVAEVIATTAMKESAGFTRLIPSVVVVAGYTTTFYFLSLTLDSIPLGIAYAIWSGLGISIISLLGWWLYGQKLDAGALTGIGFIIAGILIMHLFSETTSH